MVSTPSPPPAPDPKETAAAQAAMNKETAVAQYGLNATNQVTPQGTSTYKQIGTWADGTPRFEQTTAYSPTEQAIYETGAQTRQNLGNIGATQSQKIGQLLDTPYRLGDATQSKISQIQKGFLDPQWQQQQQSLETQLINKGIRPGSEAYQREMRDFSTNRQRAYDQSYLDSYNTAQQSALTERNQPINEITALMSGSQVSNPSFGSTPSPGVAPTDYLGAVQQNLNQQNLGYQAQVNSNQGMMSGLFGLGSAALGGWGYGGFKTSDRNAKENEIRVGWTDSGLPIYVYNYIGSDTPEMGVMAQDVLRIAPEAVATMPNGVMAVHYGKLAELEHG
jgi:hypothetical protein